MNQIQLFPLGCTEACAYAAKFLYQSGISMVDHPSPEITHLLLDAPSFQSDGTLRGGQQLAPLLRMMPHNVTIIGGNLSNNILSDYKCIDLLKDEEYLAKNAAITAECALQKAAEQMSVTFAHCPILIIGWGRIGKCLSTLLSALHANVTVAARKPSDRAMLRALGFQAIDTSQLPQSLARFRVAFNTVPEKIVTCTAASSYPDCIKIDLASKPGIECGDVIHAKGLPGVCAPESSGRLMAETILRQIKR